MESSILKRIKNTYCRLKPSEINGVGVFAIRDIPPKKNPFYGIREQGWHELKVSDFKNLNKEILKMIDDFFVIKKDATVLVPELGLNGMDISFFLNTSENPNIETVDGGFNFLTLKKIKKGEELTVSYGSFDWKYK